MDILVLHRDDHLVVVHKPAGVLVVPAPGRAAPTLIDRLGRQLGQRVFAVHRLDEQTTGALVVAITESARAAMEELFRRHAVERDYLALVAAAPSPPAGTIESQLEEGADGIVRVVRRGGQTAITHYETLSRRGRCVLVRCRLETGRRNQIRAHLAALGCPLAGDRKYGFRAREGERFPRVMLHSWRLAFDHPLTTQRVAVVVAPAEAELQP
ncbi:MAG: RluA family pseudouridine synthase [Planctomycetes bacterium]|nr:RluA family pseudouridine synthase [Planctomycetota bacterium]MCC7397491.1 RluA family pseudouridine synthase [Planctomycetota bacterium]